MNDTEIIERLWDRRLDEPETWYKVFRDYYLPLGPTRSLRAAFELYLRAESPADYSDQDPNEFRYIPAHWGEYSRRFEWAKRAASYDAEKIPDVAKLQVDMVLAYLRDSAMQAARALVDGLANERTRIQAANSILNRSGVPEVTEIDLRSSVTVTSDDMALAKQKVEKWKADNQKE